MADKKTLGWNPTYFGEPKKGTLASVIQDITNKQNNLVGDKPEVQDSVVVQAEKAKQEAANPAQQAAIAVNMKKQGKKPKNEDDAADMRDKNKKDAKGEKDAVKVHGETFEKVREFSVQSMKAALAKVYAEKLDDKDSPDVKKTADMLKKASKAHASQAKDLEKQIDDEGNAFGKALMAAKEKGEKTFTVAGKKYNVEDNTNDKSDDGDGLDKVQPKAVKKKFANRKDKDIDNDGDVDSSDKYLHKRRKAISKATD